MTNTGHRLLLDVKQAAEYLTVSEHFVRRLIRERRVSFLKIGHHVRLDAVDLDIFIDEGRRDARQ